MDTDATRNRVADRHRGTLGGRFTDTLLPAKVTIALSEVVARAATGQHLAWMLTNLLARQAVEIGDIALDIPAAVPVAARLGPLVPADGDLRDALLAGGRRINPGAFDEAAPFVATVAVRVGPGEPGAGDFRIFTTADGWAGYAGSEPAETIGADGNPIGAYVAACLCAGEIFKFVRGMQPAAGAFAEQLWLDAYGLTVAPVPPARVPLPESLALPPAVVAGVGAVANGFLHALYPLAASGDLTLLDGDPEGVADTNLNRYVLFGQPHLGMPKASTAATLFAGLPMQVRGVDDTWQGWVAGQGGRGPDLVISAVDKNGARHAIQDALPRLILGASTNAMRAQVNRYDVRDGGPCLRCRNPVEATLADDAAVAALRALAPEERAARAGGDADALETYLADPQAHCGMIAGETLRRFAGVAEAAEWSVGFVSALAGVLLAVEYLKEGMGHPERMLDAGRNTFRFQFWRPESNLNRVTSTPPEASCLCQTPMFRQAIGA